MIELFGPGTITDCIVTDNDVYGALIRCTHGVLTLHNTIVRGNVASHLVWSNEHYLVPVNACTVEGCLIAGNRVSSIGVRVTGAQSLQLSNSTVAYNTITFAHGTAVLASDARIGSRSTSTGGRGSRTTQRCRTPQRGGRRSSTVVRTSAEAAPRPRSGRRASAAGPERTTISAARPNHGDCPGLGLPTPCSARARPLQMGAGH